MRFFQTKKLVIDNRGQSEHSGFIDEQAVLFYLKIEW